MTSVIGSGYGISFAAGRMAFYCLLKNLNIGPGDEVILPGFTCSVMPNTVLRTGATPIFADIDRDTFGSDAKSIEKQITPRTRLIVAQHSFGIPCNISDIVSIGRKYGIFIMEDCAISLDSTVEGVGVGNWGDAAMFSTDHSKPLNTLIGGFFYTKNKLLYKKIKSYAANLPHLAENHQNRLFKQFLFEKKYYTPELYPRSIVTNYINIFKNKLMTSRDLFVFLEENYKRPLFVEEPCSYPYPAKLPYFLAQIGIYELKRWNREKKRRRKLLEEYLKIANKSGLDKYLPKAYTDSRLEIIPLRFVFEHPQANIMKKNMSKFIDVSWTWFKNPIICCPDGEESLGYVPGSCQIGEATGKNIINWPCVLPEEWHDNVLEVMSDVV